MFNNKLSEVEVKQAVPSQAETNFDKLRKRVAYLSYNKRNKSSEPSVPYNMQIHGEFLSQDHQKRLANRKDMSQAVESDSDESIKAIKRDNKRKMAKIDLNGLSEPQILKLTMNQINNLIMEPKILTSIPPEMYDEVL